MVIKKILEAIFEQDFIGTACGFLPNRSCHDALTGLDSIIMNAPVNFVVDIAMPTALLRIHEVLRHKCNHKRFGGMSGAENCGSDVAAAD